MRAVQHRIQWLASLAAVALLLPSFAMGRPVKSSSHAVSALPKSPGEGPARWAKGLALRKATGSPPPRRLRHRQAARRHPHDGAPELRVVLQQYRFVKTRRTTAPDATGAGRLPGRHRRHRQKNSPTPRGQTNRHHRHPRHRLRRRVCTRDCGAESAATRKRRAPNAVQASAKWSGVQAKCSPWTRGPAPPAGRGRRRLPGDVVETARGSQAVLAFATTRASRWGSNRASGDTSSMTRQRRRRPVPGLHPARLGPRPDRPHRQVENRNVGFSTATATIGICGTGFDVTCTGPAPASG